MSFGMYLPPFHVLNLTVAQSMAENFSTTCNERVNSTKTAVVSMPPSFSALWNICTDSMSYIGMSCVFS